MTFIVPSPPRPKAGHAALNANAVPHYLAAPGRPLPVPAPNHGSSARGWAGQRIVVHFESATYRATVWVNDAEVVSHEGGYTPFEADVSGHLAPSEPARITVVVNNTLSFQSIPPGVIEETPDGKRQRYWHDFFNYAGGHRTVWLYATPHPHLTEITVVTGLDAAVGTVDYTTAAADAEEAAVHIVCATPTAAKSRPAAAPSPCRTRTAGRRATGTCTTSRCNWPIGWAGFSTAITKASGSER
jgi:beta-galactosidase/beta-glucuronidase